MTPSQEEQLRKEAEAYAKTIVTNPHLRAGSRVYNSAIEAYIAGRSVSEEENEKLRKEIEDREDKWQSFHDKRFAEVTKERDEWRRQFYQQQIEHEEAEKQRNPFNKKGL